MKLDKQNITDGAAGLGCVGATAFYFLLGVSSYMLNLHELNHYQFPIPPYLAYGTKPYWPLPPALLGLLWLALRHRYPDAAKGVRFALFVTLALSLGALAVCR